MRAGAASPELSSIIGAVGTIGSAGAGQAPGGHRHEVERVTLSGNQLNGAPKPMFTASRSERRRAAAEATSSTQSCTAESVSCVNATMLPSGDQRVFRMRGSAGSPVTGRSSPSSVRRARPFDGRDRLGPLVRGLIRRPAIFSSGAETSAIEGRLGRIVSSIMDSSGLRLMPGVTGASTSAVSSAAGVW